MRQPTAWNAHEEQSQCFQFCNFEGNLTELSTFGPRRRTFKVQIRVLDSGDPPQFGSRCRFPFVAPQPRLAVTRPIFLRSKLFAVKRLQNRLRPYANSGMIYLTSCVITRKRSSNGNTNIARERMWSQQASPARNLLGGDNKHAGSTLPCGLMKPHDCSPLRLRGFIILRGASVRLHRK